MTSRENLIAHAIRHEESDPARVAVTATIRVRENKYKVTQTERNQVAAERSRMGTVERELGSFDTSFRAGRASVLPRDAEMRQNAAKPNAVGVDAPNRGYLGMDMLSSRWRFQQLAKKFEALVRDLNECSDVEQRKGYLLRMKAILNKVDELMRNRMTRS
jgi:hypothetical protein